MPAPALIRICLGGTLLTVLTIGGIPGWAQGTSSPEGGLLTRVEGAVFIEDEAVLLDPDRALQVKPPLSLRTGEDGRAELTLILEGYLRMAPLSEVKIVELGLDSARLEVRSGSVVLDLASVWDEKSITLETAQANLKIHWAGVYQIDHRVDSPLTVKTYKGKCEVLTDNSSIKLRNKTQAIVSASGELRKEGFKPTDGDPAYSWHQQRLREFREERAAARLGLTETERR